MKIFISQMTDMDYGIANNLLNLQEADAELIEAFKSRKNMYSIWNGNDLSGIALLEKGKNAYVNLFIHAPYRCNGIGDRALILSEQLLRDAGADTIMTNYRIDHFASKSFAEKHGYIRKFSSTYMEYTGCQFDIPALPVREYKDDDYESAHEIYAKAFHEMRIRVGDFPDSVIEQPNDSMRKHWASTKKDRLVYFHGTAIIGYCHVEGNEIGSISVKSQYQGQGIGRMFMKLVINKLLEEEHETVSLYCVVGNRAKLLYDSLGFIDKYTQNYAAKPVR